MVPRGSALEHTPSLGVSRHRLRRYPTADGTPHKMVWHARFPSRHDKVSHSGTVTISAIRELISAIRVLISAIRVLITAIRVLMIAIRVLITAIRVLMIAIRVLITAIRVLITAIRVPAWVAEDVDVGRPEGQAL